MNTWVIIQLRDHRDGEEPMEQAPQKWVGYEAHGVRVDWPEAGHTLIPWTNILRVDHAPQPHTEEQP
jgi:hypothetical protein